MTKRPKRVDTGKFKRLTLSPKRSKLKVSKDSHLKKHHDATPSNTGIANQSIWNNLFTPVKFTALTPGIILARLFIGLMFIAVIAQITGMIDVTGFLNPNSPTYLNINSVLFPDNEGKFLYEEDSNYDFAEESNYASDLTEEIGPQYSGNVTIDSAICRLSDKQPWETEYLYDLEIKAHIRGSVGASIFVGTNPISGDTDILCGEWEKDGNSCIRAEGNPESVSITQTYTELVTATDTKNIYLTAVLTLDPNGDSSQRIMLDIKYDTVACP